MKWLEYTVSVFDGNVNHVRNVENRKIKLLNSPSCVGVGERKQCYTELDIDL